MLEMLQFYEQIVSFTLVNEAYTMALQTHTLALGLSSISVVAFLPRHL